MQFYSPLCVVICKWLWCCADVAKANSNNEELEKLKKQLKQEQLLKMQAVNKLAEIMNRKDMSTTGRKNKVSSADLRKREKECRKLQQELTQVWIISFHHEIIWVIRYPASCYS